MRWDGTGLLQANVPNVRMRHTHRIASHSISHRISPRIASHSISHRIASHRIAQHIASHRTAYRIASHRIASQRGESFRHRSSPHSVTYVGGAENKYAATSHRIGSHRIVSHRMASHEDHGSTSKMQRAHRIGPPRAHTRASCSHALLERLLTVKGK